jgi:hypothetical protein
VLAHRLSDPGRLGIGTAVAIDTITQQAAFLNGSDDVSKSPPITRTQGQIISIQSDGTATIYIAGDPEPVPGIKSFTGYTPHAGDMVELELQGTDTIILGKLGNGVSPPAFAVVATAEQGTNGSAYVDCATVGPAVTVVVGSSGRLRVTITANMSESDSNDGGRMSVVLSGANTSAADDSRSLAFFPKVSGAYACYSRVLYYSGLTPGSTTITAKYKDSGGDNTWSQRELLAEPLA